LDVSGRLTAWSRDIVVWTDTGLCFVMLTEWFVLLALVNDKLAFVKERGKLDTHCSNSPPPKGRTNHRSWPEKGGLAEGRFRPLV
jgi:hypothetical protein